MNQEITPTDFFFFNVTKVPNHSSFACLGYSHPHSKPCGYSSPWQPRKQEQHWEEDSRKCSWRDSLEPAHMALLQLSASHSSLVRPWCWHNRPWEAIQAALSFSPTQVQLACVFRNLSPHCVYRRLGGFVLGTHWSVQIPHVDLELGNLQPWDGHSLSSKFSRTLRNKQPAPLDSLFLPKWSVAPSTWSLRAWPSLGIWLQVIYRG